MIKLTTSLFSAVIATTALGIAPISMISADEVRVPIMSQGERSNETRVPGTGMSQSSVRNGWGAPRKITAPVGEPPITQWHYQEFVVYFEENRVIHTVLKPDQRRSDSENG